ncbi:alpha/beta hydrolase [Mucilaginibacter terrae]|uniref:Acetyl esterase n=1 Tax=Mucilaginibacter terrae TaxID=1955052 RepID=A0ABU3GZX5_9SPHI|nr:alpha/beta hydrolase [Mucilaginibacter terrae]MDT3405319.1 acetyl esterase [Mucilaginibacter terrae]
MKTEQTLKTMLMVLGTLLVFNGANAQQVDANTDQNIEKQTRAFLKILNSSGGKPLETYSPKDARAVLSGLQASVKVDLSGIAITEKKIQQDGMTISLHIVKPAGVKKVLPVFMYFHGGGWILGDFPTHQRLVRDLVVNSGAAAVFVNYTPSPEAQFPVAINQAYAATKWVAAHGTEIGVNGKKLAVAGNSVGGNMAAVVSLMAKDKNGPDIKLQVLFWPVTDANMETASYNQYAEGRFLTKGLMNWFWNSYIPEPGKRNNVYASPLQAPIERLKGLPKAIVEVAENDVLRDEGETYARKMNEAGVPVSLMRYQGMIHDFGLLNPLAKVPEVQSGILQAAGELHKALFN